LESKSIRIQVIVLFLLILASFIAQIPYYFHLYYNPTNLLAQARGVLIMSFVFMVFLLASLLLFKQKVLGYGLMLTFLTAEFLFYAWNTLGGVLHGYGLFYHLTDTDLLLRAIFAIGYVNLFASGYFLFLLLLKRTHFLHAQEGAKSLG